MLAAHAKTVSASETPPPDRSAIVSWKHITQPVEPFLGAVSEGLARQVASFDRSVAPYAEYALNGDGKHLRPALVALAGNSLGKLKEEHVTVAVIVEMVHLATLVHDDVMDEGEIRRGKLTLAANWGNEIAVLFGDCLFAQALTLAASFPTPAICRAVASATNTVCAGEILQTQHRRDFQFTRDEYFKVLEMKTGELFALSSELSALLSGATEDQRLALKAFGTAFGTAYQLFDDCVDLFGTEAVAGKSLGTDLAKGKLTLPVLLAWERASATDRRALERLVTEWEPACMPILNQLLSKYSTLESSLAIVHQHLKRARQSVQELPPTDGRAGLAGLTEYLAYQTDALGA